MTHEIESLANLQQQKASLEGRIQKAQEVFNKIGTPGFSEKSRLTLDESNGLQYSENLDRVTGIQEKLRDERIPHFREELSVINQRIGVFEASTNLTLLEERYQRIQERMQKGIPVPQEALSPLEVEIERLRSLVTSVQPEQPQPPMAPKPPVADPEAPVEPPVQPGPEKEDQKETEKLPAVVINRAAKEMQINDKVISISSKISWQTLVAIIESGREGISTSIIGNVAKRAGSTSETPANAAIGNLRQLIRSAYEDVNKLITTSGSKNRAVYHFNGDVSYAPSNLVLIEGENTIEFDGRIISLSDQEMSLLKVLIENKDTVVRSGLLSQQAMGAEDPVASRLRFIMSDLAIKINYPYGQKTIESLVAGSASGYKLQNVIIETRESQASTDNGQEEGNDPEKTDFEEIESSDQSDTAIADGAIAPEPPVQPGPEKEDQKETEEIGYSFNEKTQLYEVSFPDGSVWTSKGQKKAKILGFILKRRPNLSMIMEYSGIPYNQVGAWIAQLRADNILNQLKWQLRYYEPEEKSKRAQGTYAIEKVQEDSTQAEDQGEADENLAVTNFTDEERSELARNHIANIQARINAGIGKNPEMIERAQEAAAVFGGTIVFNQPEPVSPKEEISEEVKAMVDRIIFDTEDDLTEKDSVEQQDIEVAEPLPETTEKGSLIAKYPELLRAPMNTKTFERFVKRLGLVVENGGKEHRIIDPKNNNYICPMPNSHGRRDIRTGTYRTVLKKVIEYKESSEGGQ